MSTWKMICSTDNFFFSHCGSPLSLRSLDHLWDWTNNLSALYPARVNFPGVSLSRQGMERGRRAATPPSGINMGLFIVGPGREPLGGVAFISFRNCYCSSSILPRSAGKVSYSESLTFRQGNLVPDFKIYLLFSSQTWIRRRSSNLLTRW